MLLSLLIMYYIYYVPEKNIYILNQKEDSNEYDLYFLK